MSTICAEIARIAEVKPHPNADRLDIVAVGGAESVVTKGLLAVGDLAVFFPPNLLLPPAVAERLKVANYLKPAVYPGDTEKTNCRVAACRIRGVPSFGFVTPLRNAYVAMIVPASHRTDKGLEGTDLNEYFGAVKYEPPARQAGGFNGDAAEDHPAFHKYTDIENYYKYPDAIPEGTDVRITEKIHGINCRLGLARDAMDFQLMAGSHNVNLKAVTASGKVPIYWQHMTEGVVKLLTHLCDEKHSVIVFGEIFGPGVQDLDYGQTETAFRVFDISVDGKYLGWDTLHTTCIAFGVQLVPLLYLGPFEKHHVEMYSYGRTNVANHTKVRSAFKDREGCVITPLIEQWSDKLYGRMILKSVSADYLDRKNPEDN